MRLFLGLFSATEVKVAAYTSSERKVRSTPETLPPHLTTRLPLRVIEPQSDSFAGSSGQGQGGVKTVPVAIRHRGPPPLRYIDSLLIIEVLSKPLGNPPHSPRPSFLDRIRSSGLPVFLRGERVVKPWAARFYRSKAWRKCRDAYFAYRHGLCERCGAGGKIVHHKTYLSPENIDDPDVALNWDNLELVCQTCHNQEHHDMGATEDGLTFDEDGNLVEVGA